MSKSNEDKKDNFLEMRMMARALPERMMLEMLADALNTYKEDETEDNRRQAHMVMMMVTMKWGDQENERTEEDIIKNTKKIQTLSDIHDGMDEINDIINGDS
tara:strand:+ start:1841 stop:2146 length:306 start_codon:yes stop_codon:yes gene_type:complete